MITKLVIVCLLTGCAHTLPPENYGIIETVTKTPIAPKPVIGETVEVEVEVEKTWATSDDMAKLHEAMRESVARDSCKCVAGDPLCGCL